MRVGRNACSVWLAKLKEGDPVEDIVLGERIILYWTLSN